MDEQQYQEKTEYYDQLLGETIDNFYKMNYAGAISDKRLDELVDEVKLEKDLLQYKLDDEWDFYKKLNS